jgi:hypothetical protein
LFIFSLRKLYVSQAAPICDRTRREGGWFDQISTNDPGVILGNSRALERQIKQIGVGQHVADGRREKAAGFAETDL